MRKTSISRKSSRRRLLRRQRLALALAVVLASPAAFAGVVPACPGCLPEVGNVVSGTATSNLDVGTTINPGPTTDNVMTITQTSPTAIIEWGTFSIDAGFTLNFLQPDANSVTLNRVIGIGYGPSPSYIQGTINANGNVFVVNPTGILFGKSSVVNVGGLVASTLDISDTDFTTGAAMADPHYIFTPTIRAGAPIVNQGQLTAAAGGTIALVAARIENQAGATLRAPGGSVVFGAARGVNLDFYDDGLTTVTLTGPGYTAPYGCAAGMSTSSCLGGIENSGLISSTGGHVELRTTTDDGASQPAGTPLFTEASNGGRIWIGGTISTASSTVRAGSIVLDAGMGNVDIGGISGVAAFVGANAYGAGQNAGTVDIRGFQLFTHVCVGPGGSCVANDSLGWIDATAQTGAGNGGTITINVQDLVYNAGVMQASSFSGNAGQINITSGRNVENYNWILSESGAGNGGTINITAPYILLHRGQLPWLGGPGILYSQAVLSAYGATNGGKVNLTGDLTVVDLGNVTPVDPEYKPVINVRGMNGSGGTVDVQGGTTVDIDATWFVNADGTANGGSINMSAMYMYVHGDMTANGDVNGGSIDLYAYYNLDVSGNLTANGDIDGGSITLGGSNYADVTVSGTLTANGGMTPLPANSIGNGGTINVTGHDIHVSGNLYARGGSQQSIDPNNSSLNRYSFGGHVFVYGDSVNLSGLFDTTALNDWGTVQTDAYTYLFAAATTNVTSGAWFIDSNEVWVTTAAGASAHGLGAVLVDQTLAQSLNNGTGIYLNANNSVFSASGSGAVHIDSGVSMTPSAGYLSLQAMNGIFGSGFTMSAGWGVSLVATGSDIQLDNFTMDGGTVKMQGGSVSLTSGHINTFGGGFEATANVDGITLYSTWIDDSGNGDIHLDASGSLNGIDAQWVYLDTGIGGEIKFDANNSAPGISIANSELGGAGTTGAITLLADNSSTGIVVDTSTVASGASLLIQANDGGGVSLQDSAISASGDYLHVYATGGTGGVSLVSSALDNPAGSLVIDANGSDFGVYIAGTTSLSSYGDLTLNADDSGTGGIAIYGATGATISSGNGVLVLTAQDSGSGIRVAGPESFSSGSDMRWDASRSTSGITVGDGVNLDSDGNLSLLADNSLGGGITISASFGTYLHSLGTTTLSAVYSSYGINLSGPVKIVSGGDLAIDADHSDNGLILYGSLDITSSGDITMTANNSTGGGVSISGDASGPNISSAGKITVLGTDSLNGIYIRLANLTSAGDTWMDADGSTYGLQVLSSSITSTGGEIDIHADQTRNGVLIRQSTLTSAGELDIKGVSTGTSSLAGVQVSGSNILSNGGTIQISGSSSGSYGYGVLIDANTTISSGGGDISLVGDDLDASGIWIADSSVTSGGGTISLQGTGGSVGGVDLYHSSVDSGDGDIMINGIASGDATGVGLTGSSLVSGIGDITVDGSTDGFGWGVFVYGSSLASTAGGIAVTGHAGAGYGIELRGDGSYSSGITTTSGNITLVGEGSTAGVQLNNDSTITSASGNVEIDGRGTTGAGVRLVSSSAVNAGSGTVVLRAGNDGNSDAIVLDGSITSTTAVNLRPLDETDTILLGAGNGFSVGNSDLANIHSPWLVIGSAQQQGAIQVIDALVYDSNLTLQNQGGSAGIYLGAGVDVGLHTLGLLTGGSITQDADAAIHAESLLAIAAGDVLLATAQNDVAGTTLSGSAGGVYEFLDVNALAIGNVNAFGFDANGNVLAGQAGSGISAGGNVFVQTLSGNLTMNANVNGVDVDLVTAGVFLNPAGATINASGDWRIWASTWLGEDRGGLAGNGSLPNLYNCTYGGPCGVTVGSGSHFIYTQQPTLTILIDDASREYGDANPSFNYSASGLILGDDLAYVLSGYLSSLATSGSNVGQYAITGNFTSAAGYAIAFTPGSLTITPATLLFTADPLLWYMGVPFPAFTGTISGFKNGDTAASVFGNNPYWFTNASPLSMPGFYAIYGGGNAQNYVFAQATGNQSALHLIPAAITSDQPTTFVSERNDTDVYDTNIGQVEMCPVSDSGNDQALEGGDALGGDWSKVRKRLNLLNCFSNDKKGGCSGSF